MIETYIESGGAVLKCNKGDCIVEESHYASDNVKARRRILTEHLKQSVMTFKHTVCKKHNLQLENFAIFTTFDLFENVSAFAKYNMKTRESF